MPTDTNVLGYSTLMDVVNEYTSLDATGKYIWAAEILNRRCPLVQIMPMIKSNQIMSNIGSRDAYLGAPGTRQFNQPILPTAVHSMPLVDPIAMFEDYSEVDYAMWKIQNEPNAWRRSKDRRKVEGLTQKLETTFFYGTLATDPGSFNGLATRFNSIAAYPNGDASWQYNVVSGGYTGGGSTCTSIWIIEFGEHKCFGIYPANLPGGLEIEDLGKTTKEQSTGLFEVLRTHFTWFAGMQVEDERCVQRYCNIAPTGTTSIFDENILIAMKNQLPSMGEDPGTVILMNRLLKTQVDIRAVSTKINTYFTQDKATGDVWGRPVTRFQGIPVMVAEMILNTEAPVIT